jgi:hypothetical protein
MAESGHKKRMPERHPFLPGVVPDYARKRRRIKNPRPAMTAIIEAVAGSGI